MSKFTFRRMALISLSCLFLACGIEVLQPGEPDCPADNADSTRFTIKSYDGQWVWSEDGEYLYQLLIENGQVVSLEAISRNARGFDYHNADCRVDPIDGLQLIVYRTEPIDSEYTTLVFRFDDPQARTVSNGVLEVPDMLRGKLFTEKISPETDDAHYPRFGQHGVLEYLGP